MLDLPPGEERQGQYVRVDAQRTVAGGEEQLLVVEFVVHSCDMSPSRGQAHRPS